jgi:hypothetical protein
MVSGKNMVGATGLEPATPCPPFGIFHFPQRPDFPNLFVFQYLLTHIDFTHFTGNDKF